MPLADTIARYKRKIFASYAKRRVIRVTPERRKAAPLIMTLLVFNEQEVLEKNILHHLNSGVDFIIATDNGSTDCTREILEKFARRGVLHLIDQPSENYQQAPWMNQMTALAFQRFGPCMILPCDADEFWTPGSGNLKDELLSYPHLTYLHIPVVNLIPVIDHEVTDDVFLQCKYVEVQPTAAPVQVTDLSRRYLYPYIDKVLFRLTTRPLEVVKGNHGLVDGHQYLGKRACGVRVMHYPLRGYRQFAARITRGGKALTQAKKPGEDTGLAWQTWYQDYLDGNLEKAYRSMVLDPEQVETLRKQGAVSGFSQHPEYLQKLRSLD